MILKNVGGAEEFVKKFDAGIILNNKENNSKELFVFFKKKYDRSMICKLAKEYFSIQSVSNKYLEIYLS